MQEAEVSLRVAIYHIKNGLTDNDVNVSIDGAHIKTGDEVHFDIQSFLNENGLIKIDEKKEKWQGTYKLDGYEPQIIISSIPGEGDVVIALDNGRKLLVESKKGKDNKSGQEYPLMREAIGQLMTGGELTDEIIPAVAVPYSKKTLELAEKWSEYHQIKQIGIRFILVKVDGDIEMIKYPCNDTL